MTALNTPQQKPLLSIISVVRFESAKSVRRLIDSVLSQTYPNFELLLFDAGSAKGGALGCLRRAPRRDGRVRVQFFIGGGALPVLSNRAAVYAKGEFLMFLLPGDRLEKDALSALSAGIRSDSDAVYGVTANLPRPTAFSPVTLEHLPYIGRAVMIRASRFRSLSGFDVRFPRAMHYDLLLRLLAACGTITPVYAPVLLPAPCKEDAYAFSRDEAGALSAHFARTERLTDAVRPLMPGYRVSFRLSSEPLVSIVIPHARDVSALHATVESIRSHTAYGAYEIVVAAGTGKDAASDTAYTELRRKGLRVFKTEETENDAAALLFFAAKKARGELLMLLQCGGTVDKNDWLTSLLAYAVQPDVGAAGGILSDSNGAPYFFGGTVRSGVPEAKTSGHAFVHNVSFVSEAFLMTSRDRLLEAFDAGEMLPAPYLAADYCLRLCAKGLSTALVPYAVLTLPECASPLPPASEDAQNAFRTRYPDIQGDPFDF